MSDANRGPGTPNLKNNLKKSNLKKTRSPSFNPNPVSPAPEPRAPQQGTSLPRGSQPNSQPHPASQFDGRDVFSHTVQNTEAGLVIDGVLQPRTNGYWTKFPPQYPQYPYTYPANFQYPTAPQPVNMSTVGAGLMPDPNVRHFQPPVPDTSNGPFQYIYGARSDGQNPPLGVPNGAPPAPPAYPPAGAFAIPQAQPGMATAPIPVMPQGGPMYYQPGQTVNVQPGQIPMMAYPPVAGGAGAGQPFQAPMTGFYINGNQGAAFDPLPLPNGMFLEPGRTHCEMNFDQQAEENGANEPQEFKPADDSLSRFYWTIQLDGNRIPMPRSAIEGQAYRWFILPNGVFYARRLPE
ncbi:hypothetical protein F5Y16DRAFT_298113 [Xylariaceae sp. FL0255]|nr:hypothetical protein F5Y16DRAFT_298113 [Xylariaceae sp. FL0255]